RSGARAKPRNQRLRARRTARRDDAGEAGAELRGQQQVEAWREYTGTHTAVYTFVYSRARSRFRPMMGVLAPRLPSFPDVPTRSAPRRGRDRRAQGLDFTRGP